MDWHDPQDPHRGERNLPRYFCGGCGLVPATARESMSHASKCEGTSSWSWHCWACATENWKRTDCRCCGKEAR